MPLYKGIPLKIQIRTFFLLNCKWHKNYSIPVLVPVGFNLYKSSGGAGSVQKKEAKGVQNLHKLRHTGLLCVQGYFLHSQETVLLKTGFPWQLIRGKAQLKRLSAAAACTQ